MDIGTIVDLVNFCIIAVQTIIKYKGINKEFKEKLERLKDYALRFQSLSLVIKRLKTTHNLHPRLEEDTNSCISRARNILEKAKSNLREWNQRLRHEEQARADTLKESMKLVKGVINKADWLIRGAKDTDELLNDLYRVNNHLQKGIQLCALYTPEADDADLLVIDFVEQALNRQTGRIWVNENLRIARDSMDDVDGVKRAWVSDAMSPYYGCLLEDRQTKWGGSTSDTRRLVRLLAEKPKGVGSNTPFIALPKCHGLWYSQLVLELPTKAAAPYPNLRSLLAQTKSRPTHTLNSRLRLSVDLARAVLVLHSLGLVHKDIRPESILVIGSTSPVETSPVTLGRPCLIGFGSTRSLTVATQLQPQFTEAEVNINKTLHRMIYKHPMHWVNKRTQAYQMRDDIYSLGVCLLEIAMWKSLFRWELGAFMNDPNTLRLCRPSDFPGDRSGQKWKKLNQVLLVSMAKKAIPVTMGETYKDVVVACLMCWERSRLRQSTTKEISKDTYAQEMTKEAEQSISFFKDVINKLESIRI